MMGTMNHKCRYCGGEVHYGPGLIMVEDKDGSGGGYICHEECFQLSSDYKDEFTEGPNTE